MISQNYANQLIQQWNEAWIIIDELQMDHWNSKEFDEAASIIVWTLIQLKIAGYRLSEKDFWYHRSKEN